MKITARTVIGTVIGASLMSLCVAGTGVGQARLWEEPGPCDRECLIATVEAIVAHDPDAAPLADTHR